MTVGSPRTVRQAGSTSNDQVRVHRRGRQRNVDEIVDKHVCREGRIQLRRGTEPKVIKCVLGGGWLGPKVPLRQVPAPLVVCPRAVDHGAMRQISTQELERAGADTRETHVSTVYFSGPLAIKVKKPVSMGFLDFTSAAQRRAACEAEVALNSRLSPDVYIGVADIVDGHTGDVVDSAVVMRRLADDRRLSTLLSGNADVSADLRSVARQVAAFHASSPRSDRIADAATPQSLQALWDASTEALLTMDDAPVDAAAVQHVAAMARAYVAGRAPLLAQRIALGNICDGHGDLSADDIFCLDDGPRILDGIEFDEKLRFGDVLADVAFLAMDLELKNRPEMARLFLAAYAEFSGEHHPASLAHFYIAYRALVRCKVAALRHQQTSDANDAAEAIRLITLASDHLERARSVLTLVGGLPGTGKSSLADGIGDALGWVVLRSDEVRRDIAGVGRDARAPAQFGKGIYSPVSGDATYAELTRRASALIALGESVVVDASFTRASHRELFQRAADEGSAALAELELCAPPMTTRQRLQHRADRHASDATPAIAIRLAAAREPWPAAQRIDTTASPGHCLNTAIHVIACTGVDRRPWIRTQSTGLAPVGVVHLEGAPT